MRPPAGWVRHYGLPPILTKWTQSGDLKTPAELTITHLYSSTPTPLETFKRQSRDVLKEKAPEAKILEEKELAIGGKPAYRMVISSEGMIQFKTCIHRSNLEFYLVDATYPPELGEKVRPLLEASISTFEVIPLPISAEEKLLDARTMALIQGQKIDPAMLGERWFTVHVGTKKVGHSRYKLSETEGAYAFETDVRLDFGPGDSDATTIRGSFSPDGRTQKVELEEAKTAPKQKTLHRASASIRGGQARISRELNGQKEDRSFAVEEGVLLSDVAECLRPVLIAAGKGSYLLKTLSPYSEEWKVEMVDVGGVESLEFDGKPHECILVQAYVGRRKNMTYFYGTDRSLIRAGGHREKFAIRQTTKEEALKP